MRRVTAFGAGIPTTPMALQKHGNELEWIVRQMSWKPCWCPPKEDARKPLVTKVFQHSRMHDETLLSPAKDTVPFPDEELGIPQDLLSCKDESSCDNDAYLDDVSIAETLMKEELTDDEDHYIDPNSGDVQGKVDAGAVPHPREIWQQLPNRIQEDIYGYERNPAFWFTLDFFYNYVYEVHRFAAAIETVNAFTRETFLTSGGKRVYLWQPKKSKTLNRLSCLIQL